MKCRPRRVSSAAGLIKHFNDGGPGWILSAVTAGETKHYMYCAEPPCEATRRNTDDIWRCYCTPDYVENVGPTCGSCRRPRAQGAMAPPMPLTGERISHDKNVEVP